MFSFLKRLWFYYIVMPKEIRKIIPFCTLPLRKKEMEYGKKLAERIDNHNN